MLLWMKHINTLLIWEWMNYNNRRIDGDIRNECILSQTGAT